VKWAGHVACILGIRNAYNIFVGKSERKTPTGGEKYRSESNVKTDLKELRIHVTQDRVQWRALVSTTINFVFHERRELLQTALMNKFMELVS
jgi:hypothetical protein